MIEKDSILFTKLYNDFSQQIIRLCLGYTGNTALAQDLAQETFIHVWQGLHKFRGEAQYTTWVYRIAVNTCLSYLRSPKNKSTTELPHKVSAIADIQSTKEKQVQLLFKCISQLPETERLIISMVLEDITYKNISEAVGINEGNLRVKIHRIKQQLSETFNSHEEF